MIGKVHRLGLSGRAAPSQPVFKAPRPPKPAATAVPPPTIETAAEVAPLAVAKAPTREIAQPSPEKGIPVPYVEPPVVQRGTATVLTLGAHMCKWPIGDPAIDGFSFCGRRSENEGPYCVEHARVAYQPQQVRKKSSPSDLARSLRRYV